MTKNNINDTENYAKLLIELFDIFSNHFKLSDLSSDDFLEEFFSFLRDQTYLKNFDLEEIYEYLLKNEEDSLAIEFLEKYFNYQEEEDNDLEDEDDQYSLNDDKNLFSDDLYDY
ncbi:MAG: hypothetical protein NZZ41_02090 [Candidatus Dojkabacteria bacterium]|nr:hypothetical protein [Candidatus Dojkabacteria bacterium]